MGIVVDEAVAIGKGVVDPDTLVLDAEVTTVDTALRTIHATDLGTVAIVKDLTRQTGEHGSCLGLEGEGGYAGAVLSEVYDERLTGLQGDGAVCRVIALDIYLSVFHILFLLSLLLAGDTFPYVGFDGLQGKVAAQIDLCTFRGQDLPLELLVDLWC